MSDDPSRLERLVTLRSQQETLLADAPARELAALSREYRATLAEIESLSDPEAGDGVDEVAERRAARRERAAKGSARARAGS